MFIHLSSWRFAKNRRLGKSETYSYINVISSSVKMNIICVRKFCYTLIIKSGNQIQKINMATDEWFSPKVVVKVQEI